jgi:hypothetical protein
MPFNVDVWVDDRDDGNFIIYINRELITERGAEALQSTLNAVIPGWKRLDDHLVQTVLRAVTG